MQNSLNQSFDAIAKQYATYAVLQKQVGEELCTRLELLDLEVKQLLDMGCGPAELSTALKARFPKSHLHLLDSSQEMLDQAKKNVSWSQRLFKKATLHHANALQTSFTDKQLDLVLANFLLPSIAEPLELFTEVQRITRKDGVFCFTTLGPDSFKELQSILSQVDDETRASVNLGHLIDMHIIGDALLKAGLREPVLDVEYFTLTFADFDHLWDELYYSGALLPVGKSNDENHNAIKQLLKSHYETFRSETEDGSLPVTFEVVFGQAWAGDGISKARTPEEFAFPIDQIRRR